MKNKNLIIIGAAAFAGALLYFRNVPAKAQASTGAGSTGYIGTLPRVSYISSPPVMIGQPRTDSVTDALLGRVIDLSNSTRTYGGSV